MDNLRSGAEKDGLNRRDFVRMGALSSAGLLAACAPAAAPAAAPSGGTAPQPAAAQKAAWENEWDKLVEAAKKDGRLDLAWITGAQGGYQKALDDFQKAFPGIEVGLSSFNSGALLAPKVVQEHNANVYSFDLIFMSSGIDAPMAAGALQPVKPQLFRPDALDDSKWRDGFALGWVDEKKEYGYGFALNVFHPWWINTDLANPEELKSPNDMLNPKWKGKIMMSDPRTGFSFGTITAMRLNQGEDYLKRFIQDQKPAFSRDNRLITEAMVRGQFALATGVLIPVLDEFQAQGLGKNIKQFFIPEIETLSMSHQAWMLKKPQHPNAAKLFLNWLLAREGQVAYTNSTKENSRRLDVPTVNPGIAVEPGKKYLWTTGNPAMADEIEKSKKIGAELAGLQ